MKVTQIGNVLDAVLKASTLGFKRMNPLFTGEAGIGKSEMIQQWVKKQQKTKPGFDFIDLRIAYMDAPDFVGLVYNVKDEKGNNRTHYSLPEFWPTSGEGIILLEEPNRGQPAVMNALMQLLTDRKVMGYTLPEGWLVVAAINPEVEGYDVAQMDGALRNRFTEFFTTFDKDGFREHIIEEKWFEPLVAFITENWTWLPKGEVGKDGIYISPRSLSKLNAIEIVNRELGVDQTVRISVINAVLGKGYAAQYIQFVDNDKPLLAKDFIVNREKAFERLQEITKTKEGYRGDLITPLIDSVVTAIGAGELPPEFTLDLVPYLPKDSVGDVFVKLAKVPSDKFNMSDFYEKNVDKLKSIAEAVKKKSKNLK